MRLSGHWSNSNHFIDDVYVHTIFSLLASEASLHGRLVALQRLLLLLLTKKCHRLKYVSENAMSDAVNGFITACEHPTVWHAFARKGGSLTSRYSSSSS